MELDVTQISKNQNNLLKDAKMLYSSQELQSQVTVHCGVATSTFSSSPKIYLSG